MPRTEWTIFTDKRTQNFQKLRTDKDREVKMNDQEQEKEVLGVRKRVVDFSTKWYENVIICHESETLFR